ncbi:MAG: hypothetical protein NTX25_19770 [Proteobacteria bacterium]|nr:hypothetical protein [Pseudomonadota bacterium]
MKYFFLIAPILILWLSISSSLAASAKTQNLENLAQELVLVIEKADPATSSQKEAWLPIRTAILTAGQELESTAGFKLSSSKILEHWHGKAFRLLDSNDAEDWAFRHSEQPFPDSGAWYQSRGPQWTVQYVGLHGKKLFRRGDQIKSAKFDSIRGFLGQTEFNLEVKSNPMSESRNINSKILKSSFSDYVLSETQAAGSVLMLANKSICLQKVWFWLNESVAAHVISKLNFQSEHCAAQVLDLRDAFGPAPLGKLKLVKKIPTVVLVNHETREGAVRLALQLKDEGARLIGEKTSSPLLPEQQLSLSSAPFSLLVYGAPGDGLEPDQLVKDSLLYAEGLDELNEAAISWIKQLIK